MGGRAIDPIAALPDEQVLQAGDAILMHPYLTHSSAFNYQPTLRLGMHLPFDYNLPMDGTAIAELGKRQATGNKNKIMLPPNTQLYLEVLAQQPGMNWSITFRASIGCCLAAAFATLLYWVMH